MKKILLAVDGSESCSKAVAETNDLAEKLGAEVTVLTVVEGYVTPELYSQSDAEKVVAKQKNMQEAGEEVVNSCVNIFNNESLRVNKMVKKGNPAEVICQVAEAEHYDLIVVADMGRNAIRRFLLGSTTEKVVRHASTSVLIVK
ncbi:MAG: universal stress protein [Bacillota bacterium]